MTQRHEYRFCQPSTVSVEAIAEFFRLLSRAGYEAWFHPHPFTDNQASWLAQYAGEDYYAMIVEDDQILAYGMLRGWDEGFSIPSLGIATNPDYRGVGLGRTMMQHLHDVARSRDATEVRLTVDVNNRIAQGLYSSFGYEFEPHSEGRLLGKLSL
jgi:ribosomal protein S18 acetylase RimI-like enzyme